jgi:PKD repeat protein
MKRTIPKATIQRILLTGILFVYINAIKAQAPVAGFSVANQQGCPPFSVNFTNTSVNAVSYQWDFGNGNYSTLPNPQNVYVNPGSYHVRLIVTSGNGQRDTLTRPNYINAIAGPVTSFTSSTSSGCVNQTSFNFTSSAPGATSYFWDFGDGFPSTQANPTKVFTTPGVRSVSLMATNAVGCATVFNSPQQITVHALPTASFSANITQTCNPNQAFQFTSANTGAASYLWQFGDNTVSTQANPTKTYTVPGTYTVKLKVTNAFGCVDSLTRSNYITIQAPVNPQIIASDSSGCIPFSTLLSTNITGASSYSWNFGNGQVSSATSFQASYPQAGNYPVSLTVTMPTGCAYSVSIPSFIQTAPQPTANFTIGNTSGCVPLTITLNNLSVGASSYLWQFGDGTSSTLQNPVKTFTSQGVYWVRLISTNAQGCTRQFQLNNAATVIAPQVNFSTPDTMGCPPLSVQFTNQTQGATTYKWLFGDNTSSTSSNPAKSYTTPGVYDVTLIAYNGAGCSDTLTIHDYIHVNYQIANYTTPPPASGCAPFSTSFSLSDPAGVSYLWNFGDGTTSTASTPSHVYENPGQYMVTLLIDNGSPCLKYYPVFQVVNVEGRVPVYNVSVNPCPPFEVTFSDTTHGAVSWLWDFGDGVTSTLQNPTHIFSNTSPQHVGLTITTSGGCTYSYVGFNAVNFLAFTATFTSSYDPDLPFPKPVQFTSTNPAAISWLWDFGDGTTSTEQNPVHIYQSDSAYQVSLVISNGDCSVTTNGTAFAAREAVEENQSDPGEGGSTPPEQGILPDPLVACAPATVSFQRKDSSHVVLLWNFGDGTTSTQQSPFHLYSQPGLYSVYYIISTNQGSDTIHYQQSVLIGGATPAFDIEQTAFCSSTLVSTSLHNPGLYSQINWNFGDSLFASTPDASYNFPISNTAYTIVLNTRDSLGCSTSVLQSIFTNPRQPEINYAKRVCNDTVHFDMNLVNTNGLSFLWEFGDSTSSTEYEPSHLYTHQGIYQVKLTISDGTGCQNTFTLSDRITFAKPEATFEALEPLSGCARLNIKLKYPGNDIPKWQWWTGSFSHTALINDGWSIPGIYGFKLHITSRLIPNCTVSQMFDSVITIYGASPDFTHSSSGHCLPQIVQFTDTSPDAVSWFWDFGNGITSTLQNPLITFSEITTDSIRLSIVTSHGCIGTIKKPAVYFFHPEVEAVYSGICNPLPVHFSTSDAGIISWRWDFGDGQTSTEASPTHVYTQNGNYVPRVIVTSAQYCVDTVLLDTIIRVDGPMALFNSPTPASCAPSIVEFVDNSVDAVSWLWDFGDGSNSTISDPTVLYDAPGQYNVTLIVSATNGCQDTLRYVNYVTVLGPATSFNGSGLNACKGSTIQFTDLSLGAVEWEWNFGEGSVSNEQNPEFTFNETGSYVITLFSKDTLGCSAFYTIPAPLEIYPLPHAEFTVDNAGSCVPYSINTSNTSTGASTYSWNFNDFGNSTLQSPGFTFVEPGVFSVSLIASSEFGCKDTFEVSGLSAGMVPVAGFNLSGTEGCVPLSVTFNNTSYNTEDPVYSWQFGNGESSAEITPTVVYYSPGFYTVDLKVTNSNGCSDTLSLPSIVLVFDTLPAPVTPILRVTVEGPEEVFIEWEESTAADFGAYDLFRKNLISGAFELIATIHDGHSVGYHDSGLNTFDNVYCYQLKTRDRCGYALQTDDLITHCTIDVETTTRADNTIELTWTPYIGKAPSQYRVFRYEENATIPDDLGTVAGDQTRFTDSTVYCPIKYKYSVRAEGLNGQWHVESNSDFDLSAPIQNLFVNQQVNTARSTVVDNQFVFTEWLRPTIMAQRVNGYKVFRSADNEHFYLLATVPAQQTFYLDQEVNVNRTKYYYRVLATNSCGLEGVDGQFSDNVVLKAEPGEDFKINLDWTPYLGWGPQGVGVYIIERQKDDGTWEVIEQTPGNVISTVDEN